MDGHEIFDQQRSFPHTGGSGTIAVISTRECSWTISSDVSWILLERSSGQGEQSLPFRVMANGTPNARRATLAVASTQLDVAQDASGTANQTAASARSGST
jgi:hypothetical protein